MSFIAVIDACALYPASLRDTLLTAAEFRLYKVRITDDILEEVRRNLAQDRMSEENAQKLVTTIKEKFAEEVVTRHKALIDAMPINSKDRHVLAAAVVSSADIIVTQNLRDFPNEQLSQFEIEAISPDAFLLDLFNIDPERMKRVLIKQAGRLRKPAMTVTEVLNVLIKHAPNFEKAMQKKFKFLENEKWIEKVQI